MQSPEIAPLRFDRTGFDDAVLIDLYTKLVRPRLIEEKMLILLRQNKVSKWFSGIGQEAISVGVTAALEPDEFVFTLHRNLGVFTTREVPLRRLLCQWEGKEKGFTKGRDRSFHFGAPDYHIVGMISHLGPQLTLADGTALGHRLKGEPKVSVTFTGEGGTSEGDFHEALNVASVWKLPVIFVVENNGYGLSTRPVEQYACAQIADRGIGYGMEAHVIDGNNILEVYGKVKAIAEDLRQNPRPVLLEFITFRMRGHEEASGTKYVPKELMETWGKKDPIDNYERFLVEQGMLNAEKIEKIQQAIRAEITDAVEFAFAEPHIAPSTATELADVYAPFDQIPVLPDPAAGTTNRRLVDAISDGLREAMRRHPNLVLMGQDIADYGGVFKITEGFMDEFGKDRVRNTPICESAIVGAALGLSLKGFKAMMEMQFADFVTCGFNQIVNNLAKLHWRWGKNADVVVRMPTGAGVGAGPFHSQSNEAWFYHTPGLKIVYPSNPIDAKGLLLAAFEDPNPVMFFEHKALYRRISADVPNGYYTTEIGKAALAQEGTQLSIVTYGFGVHWALEACQTLGVSADVLDLRTLLPLDHEAIARTVRKTNRVILLHEDSLTGGIGGDIAAWIGEHCFEHLDAPVVRVASLDTPIPFADGLEKNFLPAERLKEAIQKLLSY
jgi:2-oxoisovalerate dehydrogenase E1 component